jgi:hypothetical protein
MRRLALGCLLYTPERFGSIMVGDFLDAMAGYNEAENERLKGTAELIRTSTTILVNIQLDKKDRIKPQELWPFTWDKTDRDEIEIISDEERLKDEAEMEKILTRIDNGNSNIES